MPGRLQDILTATAPPVPTRPASGAPRRAWAAWAWRRASHGLPARYPLVQWPNAPLWLSFAASALGRAVSEPAQPYAQAASWIGLAVWAWLELTAGVNLWRRLLGAGGLVWLVVQIGDRLA